MSFNSDDVVNDIVYSNDVVSDVVSLNDVVDDVVLLRMMSHEFQF